MLQRIPLLALLLALCPITHAQTTQPPPTQAPTETLPDKPALDPDRPMHIGGSIKPPYVLQNDEPKIPKHWHGNAMVQVYCWVDVDGTPSHIKVYKSPDPQLNQNAIDAVAKFKFRPAMQNGKPVKVDLYIDVMFTTF